VIGGLKKARKYKFLARKYKKFEAGSYIRTEME